jgi:hypothetical protein
MVGVKKQLTKQLLLSGQKLVLPRPLGVPIQFWQGCYERRPAGIAPTLP